MSAADILATAQLYFDFTTDSARLDGNPHIASDLLTVARGMAATAPDGAGFWHQFGRDVLRLTDNGLLIEFSKVNTVFNNTYDGARLGVIGSDPDARMPTGWTLAGFAGLTVEIVNLLVEDGIEVADFRIKGTATGTFGEIILTDVFAAQATVPQVWTGSFFTSLRAGQMLHKINNFGMVMRPYTAGSVGLTDVTLISNLHQTVFDKTLRRVVGSVPLSDTGGSYAVPIVVFAWAATQPVDFTIRIGWPQFEQGNFASSPVRTFIGSGAGLRISDTVDFKPGVITPSTVEGTVYVEYVFGPDPAAAEQKGLFAIGGGNSDLIHAWLDSDVRLLRVSGLNNNITTLGPITSGSLQYGGVVHRLATAFGPNELRATYDGATGIPGLNGAMPAISPFRIALGRIRVDISDKHIDGFLRKFAYWPTRLSDADFNVLTATDILDNAQVDLDFVANKGRIGSKVGTATEMITAGVGNGGWVSSSDGDWTFTTWDIPRRSDLGLLVENAKLNEMVNARLLGAQVGTIQLSGGTGSLPTLWYQTAWNGPFLAVTGIGVDHGMDYIDIAITGTTAHLSDNIFLEYYAPNLAGNGPINQGDPWVGAIFLANMGDNLNNLSALLLRVAEYQAGPGYLADTARSGDVSRKLTRRLQRVVIAGSVQTQTSIIPLTTIRLELSFSWPIGALVDLHFRIGWPTLERAGFASSPMPTITYGAPAQRQADNVQVIPGLMSLSQTEGTLYVEYVQPPDSRVAESQGAGAVDSGGPANRVYIQHPQPGRVPFAAARNVNTITLQVDAPSGIPSALPLGAYGHLTRVATAFAANDMRAAFNGSLGTPDTAGTLPLSAFAAISVGKANGGNADYLDSFIHTLRYWPTQLSNAQLQALTALPPPAIIAPPSPYSREARAIFEAFTIPPDDTRKGLISGLVMLLMDGGAWAKLDVLYVFAAHDQQAALINWKAPGSFTAIAVGAPPFTVDRGFTGGAAAAIDTTFNPRTMTTAQFTQDTASLFAWSLTAGQSGGAIVSNLAGDCALVPRDGDDLWHGAVNSSVVASLPASDGSGYFVGERSAPDAAAFYRNATFLMAPNEASVASTANPVVFLAGIDGSFNGVCAGGGAGGTLTVGEQSDIYTALHAYLQAVGAIS